MEQSIKTQIGENAKNGIYEVFVEHQEYYTYFGLGESKTPKMNQKMHAIIWDGEIEMICLDYRRAWSEFKSIAEDNGVEVDLSK